jgi:hypothetical protein
VGILTMGGGFGVVTAEACEKEGLSIARLSQTSLQKLNGLLPSRWSHGNPVDLVGIKHMGEDRVSATCLDILMEDPGIDILISLLPPVAPLGGPAHQLAPEQIEALKSENSRRLDQLAARVRQTGKPLFLLRRFNFPQEGLPSPGEQPKRIPEFANTRRVARVLHHLVGYSSYLKNNA